MKVPRSTPIDTAEEPMTSWSNWNQTTSYMSAAQPLPTNRSSSAGRNRRGVIQGTFLASLNEENGCYHGDIRGKGGPRLPGGAGMCQRSDRHARQIQGGGLMAWWTRKTAARDERSPVDPNMPLIRLEGITRTFKGDAAGEEAETVALDHVTVDIDRGEYISISGPSGCGKSTMLSILDRKSVV